MLLFIVTVTVVVAPTSVVALDDPIDSVVYPSAADVNPAASTLVFVGGDPAASVTFCFLVAPVAPAPDVDVVVVIVVVVVFAVVVAVSDINDEVAVPAVDDVIYASGRTWCC